jgi:hypothetical protein
VTFWSVVAGIAIGVAGTFAGWLIKTRIFPPRLQLSELISRRAEQGGPCYRVKLGNYSWQAATDLQIRAVLRAHRPDGSIAVVQVGTSTDDIDLLPARALGDPGRHRLVYLQPARLSDFARDRLPAELRARADNPALRGPLLLEDLLGLGSPAVLTITVSCFNGISGARRWFTQHYTAADITTASFERGSLHAERSTAIGGTTSGLSPTAPEPAGSPPPSQPPPTPPGPDHAAPEASPEPA